MFNYENIEIFPPTAPRLFSKEKMPIPLTDI